MPSRAKTISLRGYKHLIQLANFLETARSQEPAIAGQTARRAIRRALYTMILEGLGVLKHG
jgi:hypothetical protein